jgi:hypothetical protein
VSTQAGQPGPAQRALVPSVQTAVQLAVPGSRGRLTCRHTQLSQAALVVSFALRSGTGSVTAFWLCYSVVYYALPVDSSQICTLHVSGETEEVNNRVIAAL